MVKALVTKAVQPGIDSAAAHKTLNFCATQPPSKAEEALHGTVNISKSRLVSLLVVAICVGNMLTTLLLSKFQTFSYVLDNNYSIIYNTALKLNTVRLDSQEDDLDEELLEDDADFGDWDDDAVKPEPESEAKLRPNAGILKMQNCF